MSDNPNPYGSDPRRAFQQGVLLAFAIAFAPLALIALGLFFSGTQPRDFNPDLRYGLLGLWLVYVFTADKIAKLSMWLRVPLLRSANTGEVITVIAFSALLATLRIDPGMARAAMAMEWVRGFGLILALLGGLYLFYKATLRARRIARARRRQN